MTCIQCGNEIPDTAKFCPYCGFAQNTTASSGQPSEAPGFGNAPHEEGNYQNPTAYTSSDEYYGDIPTHLQFAILTCCCCFPIVGIVAVLFATRVSVLLQSNRYEEAKHASDCALKWSRAAIVCWLLIVTLVCVFNILTYVSHSFK